MPQISEREFERLPLRVHRFLAGVPLHDVWAVELPSPRAGITLDEFLRAANERLFTPTPVVRGLGPTTSYRTPLRVGQPTTVDAGRADVCRPAHGCRSGAIARASGRSQGAKWAVSRRLSVRERKTGRTDQPDGPRGCVERVGCKTRIVTGFTSR